MRKLMLGIIAALLIFSLTAATVSLAAMVPTDTGTSTTDGDDPVLPPPPPR